MPTRTKEQLQQIYEDLVAVREVVNQLHNLGELWPTPMNGKTWEEEKNEWYYAGINAMSDLLRSGKIKSCEVVSLCEALSFRLKADRVEIGFWNHYGSKYYSSGDQVLNNRQTSIDEMMGELHLAIQGRLPENGLSQLESNIDNFGNSACDPRAMLENAGKSIELDNNLSLPKVNNVNCHFRA